MSAAKNPERYIHMVEELNGYLEDLINTCETTDEINEMFAEHLAQEEANGYEAEIDHTVVVLSRVKELKDYIKGLSLSTESNDQLIGLMIDHMQQTERDLSEEDLA